MFVVGKLISIRDLIGAHDITGLDSVCTFCESLTQLEILSLEGDNMTTLYENTFMNLNKFDEIIREYFQQSNQFDKVEHGSEQFNDVASKHFSKQNKIATIIIGNSLSSIAVHQLNQYPCLKYFVTFK